MKLYFRSALCVNYFDRHFPSLMRMRAGLRGGSSAQTTDTNSASRSSGVNSE